MTQTFGSPQSMNAKPKTAQENHFHDLIALAFKEEDLLRITSQVIGHPMTAKEKARIYCLLLQPDF